jgi:hypothetical protein
MVKYFKCIIVLLFLMIMLQACLPISVVNKDYWSCNSTDSSVYFANSMYLELTDINKFYLSSMILYSDGYCALSHVPEFWKRISDKQFLKRGYVRWGRYKMLNDSIVIQFFIPSGCGGGSPNIYTVSQLAGKMLLTNKIIISSYQLNYACSNSTYKKGYNIVPIDTLIYLVKNIPIPSDSSNWLQRKNIK